MVQVTRVHCNHGRKWTKYAWKEPKHMKRYESLANANRRMCSMKNDKRGL